MFNLKKYIFNKKGVASAVIATALLFIAAIFIIIGFGVWISSSYSGTTQRTAQNIVCPTNYLFVSGNPSLSIVDFCVMKYEAKNVGGVATSQATLSPWASINQTDARIVCSKLGAGYHLITDPEWMTIAREIEQVPSNWNSNVVGSDWIYSGHNDGVPSNALNASINDNDGYYGTGNTASSNQRRTLTLSNGGVIWDFSGNVEEWDNNTLLGADGSLGGQSNVFHEWTSISGYNYFKLSNLLYNSTQGVGKVYTYDSAIWFVKNHAFLRGGFWANGDIAGVLALFLGHPPSFSALDIGFRCSYMQ